MVNPKRQKFNKAIKETSKNNFDGESILSIDLADKIGSIEERVKITIRLDSRVIEAAKKLDDELGGVGYQKIINDHLLVSFGVIEGPVNLGRRSELQQLLEQMKSFEERFEKRLKRLERKQA